MINTTSSSIFLKKGSFVALGYINSDSNQPHAAIIIKNENLKYQFHFLVKEIEFSPLKNIFFINKTDTIDPDEIPAFIAYCINISKRANPKFGLFYSGDYFDNEGNHFGNKDVGERMTCVGFCLSTLKGFLESNYIFESDWTFNPKHEGYFEDYCKENELDPLMVKSSFRRITPGEFLTSSYFSNLPIRKSDIDQKYPIVKSEVNSLGYNFI